ncbi:MAG: hypothetical protein KY392_01860 [Chloroflexi bacterium]|nr:hypothetical protein [Chloroflexota bacterium]
MSPSRRRRVAGVAGVAVAALPAPVLGHAIGGTYQLPLPLWMYLVGAAVAVGASFVVTALLQRRAADAVPPRWPVPGSLAAVTRWALRAIGLAWWYGAIAVGFVVGDISPLPAVLLWIGIWVGLPIAAVLLGNPWPSLSPFRTTFAALEWVGRRAGLSALDLGVTYPSWLARWPAVVLLAAALWFELIHPEGEVAATVATLMLRYTLLTLAGMVIFGQVAWLRNAELFEVLLGWFGRIGPIGRRAVSATLCAGCGDACDPARCVDCPECAVAADDAERVPELRPWTVGLTEVRRAGWSDAVFIVLALAGVSYDGMSETAFGATLLGFLLPPIEALFGLTGATFLLVDTLAFGLVVAGFLAAFGAMVLATHRLSGRHGTSLRATAGAYAPTLLPIAAGYLVAHYLTLVIQGVVWLPSLVVDPLNSLQPELDWIPVAFVWYLSVVSIVAGHVVAIVLAHRIALRDRPSAPVRAGLPMVALMIGYTILSLWIIAQPIVVDPSRPAALP